MEYIPKKYSGKKVLGVLIPAAEEAVKQSKTGTVGVIATEATVQSKAFVRELRKLNPDIRVIQQACPLLVPMIESGEHDTLVFDMLLARYLHPLLTNGIDTLILGCTHYGILERKIGAIAGPDVRLMSEIDIVPKKLREYLTRHTEIERTLTKNKRVRFFTTELTPKFTRLGSKLFGKKIRPEKAVLV